MHLKGTAAAISRLKILSRIVKKNICVTFSLV